MYPVFDKSLNSNLEADDKSAIWKQMFRILRTLMNVEPSHINRLYKGRNLLDILRYCLRKAGKHEIITKELLNEIYNIVKDIKFNNRYDTLKDFYRQYFNEIILNFDLCMSKCKDTKKKRSTLVLNELIDFLS
jgi:hypothetical protein